MTDREAMTEPVSEVTNRSEDAHGFVCHTISPFKRDLPVGTKLYAAPPAVQTVSGGRRILLARFAKRRHESPPAMWYEWDGPDRASDHEYRYATLDEEAK